MSHFVTFYAWAAAPLVSGDYQKLPVEKRELFQKFLEYLDGCNCVANDEEPFFGTPDVPGCPDGWLFQYLLLLN